MPVNTLIFDLDGTLAETRHDIAAATNHTRSHFNMAALNVEAISGYVGDGIAKLLLRALPDLATDQLQNASAVFSEYYALHLADTTKLYPGIYDFLNKVKHLNMAVLSNKAQPFTDKIIDTLGIRPFFRIVMGSTDRMPRKPAPDALHNIIRTLNAEPSEVLMIGDSKNDILAGQAAGVKTCAVTWGFRPEIELKLYNPDIIIHEISELNNFLDA